MSTGWHVIIIVLSILHVFIINDSRFGANRRRCLVACNEQGPSCVCVCVPVLDRKEATLEMSQLIVLSIYNRVA